MTTSGITLKFHETTMPKAVKEFVSHQRYRGICAYLQTLDSNSHPDDVRRVAIEKGITLADGRLPIVPFCEMDKILDNDDLLPGYDVVWLLTSIESVRECEFDILPGTEGEGCLPISNDPRGAKISWNEVENWMREVGSLAGFASGYRTISVELNLTGSP